MKLRKVPNHVGVLGVVLALVAGCSASPDYSPHPTGITNPTLTPLATASPTPAPSAAAAPSSAATPSASPNEAPPSGWPYTSSWEINDALFREDGRVVLVESHWWAGEGRVTVLNKDGSTVPGWPWTPGPTGDAALGVAFGPDGSLYVQARGKSGSPIIWSYSLHRLTPDGNEMAGFPIDLPAVAFCDLAVNEGAAITSCQDEEEDTGVVTSEVRVVERDGSTRDGWPVRLPGGMEAVGFGRDGRVYLEAGSERGTITALARDGTLIAGWPRKIRSGARVQVDRQGRVRVTTYRGATGQCGLPARTVYTMVRADGSTGPGWPVSVSGWSSEPELADDGTMVVAAANGRVTAYSRRGQIKDGWPVRRVGVTVGCTDGSRPWASGDGGMVVVGDGRATLLSADGRVASGWPVALPYRVARSCVGCTPGPAGPLAPAVGKRAVYVGAYRGGRPRVMVMERGGSMPSDAQRRLGKTGDALEWLRIAPTGRVWALLTRWNDDAEQTLGELHLVAEDNAPDS